MYSDNSSMPYEIRNFKFRFRAVIAAVLCVFLVAGWATAQTSPTQSESAQPPPGAAQATPSAPSSSQRGDSSIESPKPITKAEAKALFRSVDEIMQFVSHDTGLPIRHKVKKKLITRDQVEAMSKTTSRVTKTCSALSARSWCCASSA